MIKEFSLNFSGRILQIQVECKPCSKDGLKYICTIPDRDPFRIRKNEDSVWIAKHADCPVDPTLIRAIGEQYESLSA